MAINLCEPSALELQNPKRTQVLFSQSVMENEINLLKFNETKWGFRVSTKGIFFNNQTELSQ